MLCVYGHDEKGKSNDKIPNNKWMQTQSDVISKFVVYSYSVSTGIKVQVNSEVLGL